MTEMLHGEDFSYHDDSTKERSCEGKYGGRGVRKRGSKGREMREVEEKGESRICCQLAP